MNRDLYTKRVYRNGVTYRERAVNNAKNTFSNKLLNSISTKEILRNNIMQKLVINSGTKPYYKKIRALPNEDLFAGDIIELNNTFWLVDDADFDNEVYIDGNMTQCTFKIKWIDKNRKIKEKWATTQNASSYSTGTNADRQYTIGYDQLMVRTTFDEDTKNLKRGIKFFIDNNTVEPTAYEITRIDTTSYVYNGHGYVSIICSECQITKDDNIELLLCDYKEPRKELFNDCEIMYKSLNIKSGVKNGTKFTGVFYDNDGNVVNDVVAKWDIKCDFMDELIIDISMDSNVIKIATLSKDIIGRQFTLIMSCDNKKYERKELVLTVTSIY